MSSVFVLLNHNREGVRYHRVTGYEDVGIAFHMRIKVTDSICSGKKARCNRLPDGLFRSCRGPQEATLRARCLGRSTPNDAAALYGSEDRADPPRTALNFARLAVGAVRGRPLARGSPENIDPVRRLSWLLTEIFARLRCKAIMARTVSQHDAGVEGGRLALQRVKKIAVTGGAGFIGRASNPLWQAGR